MARRFGFSVALPLALGALVYLLARPSEAIFVAWVERLPALGPFLARARELSVPLSARVGPLDVLPDFLWALALGSLLALAWRDGPPRPRAAWAVLGAVVAIGYELGQRFGLVPGSYSTADVLAQSVGYLLGWLLHPHRPRA